MESYDIHAVLFDMDGVLIDSNAVIEKAWRDAAKKYDKEISDEQIRLHIHGQPGPHTIQSLFSDLSLIEQQKVQAYIIHAENTAEYNLIAGVSDFIYKLHQSRVKIGIVTSGWREKIDRIIALLNAQSFISVIVERDDLPTGRGKPHPDPYLLAAKRLNLSGSQTLVFEDSRSGVTSAVAAGAYCIGIGVEDLVPLGAKCVIPDFSTIEVLPLKNKKVNLRFNSEHHVFVTPVLE